MLSVVIPAFNEAGAVMPAVRGIREVLVRADIPHELVFVDDGSLDATWAEITRAAEECPGVRGVSFSRNFGKEAAIFAGLEAWAGFKTTEVEFNVAERAVGRTHWSTLSLIRYAVRNITSYSSAPMQAVTVLGVLMLLFSLVLGIQTLVNWARGTAADGFTTVIILLLLIGSVLMISLGIIGYYIAQIFAEVKGRPRYLVARSCGAKRGEPEA